MRIDHDLETIFPTTTGIDSLSFGGKAAINLPIGNDFDRPINPVGGALRFHDVTERIEFFNRDEWRSVITGEVTPGSNKISVTNGAHFPVIDVIEQNMNINSIGGIPLQISRGGTNLTSIGTPAQILGVNMAGNALEYKTITAGSNITVTHSANNITIASTAGGLPGGINSNIQFNNNGVFGGSNTFNFIDSTNPRVELRGTNLTTQLAIGVNGPFSTAQMAGSNNATVYIENFGDATSEGLRVWFRRTIANADGWITYDYDQTTPNIRLTDQDDDPPYIQFNTIGTGTYSTPLFSNIFGSRGPVAGATTGFAWRIGSNQTNTAIMGTAPVMELDRQFLRIPTGTTVGRPLPVIGQIRYNTDLQMHEGFGAANWVQFTGVIAKSTTPLSLTTAAGGSFLSTTIPGNTLIAGRMLRIRACGTFLNNSGTGRTCTLNFTYGNLILWSDASPSTASNAIPLGWNIDVILAADTISSQNIGGTVAIGGVGVLPIGRTGDLGTDEILSNAIISGSIAINAAVSQLLDFRVSFNGGSINWTRHFFYVEVL